jgi:molybdopterin adenylyltransferase
MAHAMPAQVARGGLLHIPVLDLGAGAALRRVLRSAPGVVVVQESYAASERNWIEATICRWCDEEELDLILTVGGTLPAPGPSSREVTPEATAAVLERPLPGLDEAMRRTAALTMPLALLDRGVAGIRGRTLIVNLPAGAGAATQFLEAVVALIPPILAHLRDDPAAPRLDTGITTDSHIEPETDPAGDEQERLPSRGKGLNAADFAEFLRRRKSAE